MTNVKFKQVVSLPSTSEVGAIYFTSDGKIYLGKSDGGFLSYGSDFNLTKESIITALGFTPANEEDLEDLEERFEQHKVSFVEELPTTDAYGLFVKNTQPTLPIPERETLEEAVGQLTARVALLENIRDINTLVFVTNNIVPTAETVSLASRFNATLVGVKTLLNDASDLALSFDIQKSTNGLDWTTISSATVPVGQVINDRVLDLEINTNELLRIVTTSLNEDVEQVSISLDLKKRDDYAWSS